MYPPFTAVPNQILECQHKMNESEFRVTLALLRLSHGYQTDECEASYGKLQEMTGLSRGGVASGVAATNARGFIVKIGRSKWRSLVYSVDRNSPIDRPPGAAKQSNGKTKNGLTDRPNSGDTLKEINNKETNTPPTPPAETEFPEPFKPKYLHLIPVALQKNRFLGVWATYEEYHASTGKALPPITAKRQLDKMAKWGLEHAIEAMNHSMDNKYTGLVEPGQKYVNGHRAAGPNMDEILSTAFD